MTLIGRLFLACRRPNPVQRPSPRSSSLRKDRTPLRRSSRALHVRRFQASSRENFAGRLGEGVPCGWRTQGVRTASGGEIDLAPKEERRLLFDALHDFCTRPSPLALTHSPVRADLSKSGYERLGAETGGSRALSSLSSLLHPPPSSILLVTSQAR